VGQAGVPITAALSFFGWHQGGVIGTSESFVELAPPAVAQGVKTARTGRSSSGQFQIIGQPTSFLGPRARATAPR
jgi:hypothetical protein